MIPVTDEMVEALFERACGGEFATTDDVRHGIAAVLAIVERDHLRPAPTPTRCSACGRTARRLQPRFDNRGEIDGWLGPGCYRKHLDQLREAAMGGESCQLIVVPIGGDR